MTTASILRVSILIFLLAMLPQMRSARADELIAFYHADWVGLPAAAIKLRLTQSGTSYKDQIYIATEGLPRWFTHFKGGATGQGELGGDGRTEPTRYEARYDLRSRHDSRIGMNFVKRDGAILAERGKEDTSRKPQLADKFRRDVIDPIAALAAIRQHLRIVPPLPGQEFKLPVYDGARRFDVGVKIVSLGGEDKLVHLLLSLRPIAGFKGETSDDEDPDDAPRPVNVAFTNDARLLPVSLSVSVVYLPLTVRFDHLCADFASCGPDSH